MAAKRLAEGAKARTARGPASTPASIPPPPAADESEEREPAETISTERDGRRITQNEKTEKMAFKVCASVLLLALLDGRAVLAADYEFSSDG